MRPVRLAWSSAPVPFRVAFAHASATRRRAENLLVRVEDAQGRIGLGEGCPRAYVSGETVASAAEAVAAWSQELLQLEDVHALRQWLTTMQTQVDRAPSAACAVELALLDLFARQVDAPVEDLLGRLRRTEALGVTAVYGSAPTPVFLMQHARFRAAGMGAAKLKLTGDGERDARRARRLARHGPLRLDANNLWSDADAAVAGLTGVRHSAWAVEEPVSARDWEGLAAVGRRTGLAIILDESFSGETDLERLQPGPRYLLNARLSHLGGLIRSLDAIDAARTRGVDVILGSHVGETSILTRAGLAAAAGMDPVAYEGAYGTWLLKYDLAAPSLTFGKDGHVRPGREWNPEAPGWGLALTAPLAWTEV